MSVHPRTWWLLGGCGCALLAFLVGGSALLWYLWPSPALPRKPPVATRSGTAAGTIEAIRAERNGAVRAAGPTLYGGTLEPGREAAITCDPGLTLRIPAGTFAAPEPVTVKKATVDSDVLAPLGRTVAAYEVTIGRGGPLPKPITLIFNHDPVPTTADLVAARWDTETTAWVPLRLTRRSTTVSLVETDHLSIAGLFEKIENLVTVSARSAGGRYERRRSADGRVVVYLQKGVVPQIENLFVRPGDRSRSVLRRRVEDALDAGGYTDLRKPKRGRYTDGAMRDLFVDVLARMGSRIMESYMNFVYNPPLVVEIYVDTTFADPQLLASFIGMAPAPIESPEELAVNLAHECFHACQQNTDSGARAWMGGNGRWLAEATAEYASTRVAWGDLLPRGERKARPFLEEGVSLDGAELHRKMGDKITRDFLASSLTVHEGDGLEHAYQSAHFLEYLFFRTKTIPDFMALFNLMTRAGSGATSEDVLETYGLKDDTPIGETWSDFVAFLVLDEKSPAGGGLKTAHPLRTEIPSWNGPLSLPAPFTGAYEVLSFDPLRGEPQRSSLRLTLESPGAESRVLVYRTTAEKLPLLTTRPTDRAVVAARPAIMGVPVQAGEKVFVVASRGRVADPGLTLRAELAAFEVKATRQKGSRFLLEVTPRGPIGGELDYQWETGDPGVPPTRTPTPALEYTYRKPGERQVRVALLGRDARGSLAGEATGRVTVPSSLQITILNATTGRPVGGASVRIRYEGKTASWGTDPSGVGRVDDVPPREVSFSLVASADGYETFTKTSAIDMSEQLVIAKSVRLTPKPRVPPPPPSRPPAPPSEPTRRPEPTAVPTPTPKAPPQTSSYDACMASYRQRLAEARAHNRAQNPDSQSITTKVMGTDARCSSAYSDCLAAVKERGRSCPVGPDGTFSHCFAIDNRGWIVCANEEIDCSERSLDAQCRGK